MKEIFTKELADACGIPAATLITWRNRYDDFPQPEVLRRKLIWKQADVVRVKSWMKKNGK